MAPAEKPLQLLEISILSAQNLEPVARKMKTYAIAWINSERKLSSRIDTKGYNNPTWNDKFIFHVDEEFLRCKTSGIFIEIYSTHWYRDILVGTVHVLVGNIVPPNTYNGGMRCVAVQVRRPSGRTQGILNIGVEVVDNTMGMSLHRQMSGPSVGLRDLMGMEDDESHLGHNYHQQTRRNQNYEQPSVRPTLFRSRSEVPNSSIKAPPLKIGNPGSTLSELDLQEKPKPKGYKKKASSFSIIDENSRKDDPKTVAAGKPIYNTGKYILLPYSMISASEVGPSPSEGYPLEDDASTSIVGEWTLNENGEDLRLIKLDKWRSELPPLYDPVFLSESNFRSNSQRKKGHDDGGDSGLFSILGNICGYDRRCVCGKPPSTQTTTKAKSRSRRFRSSSIGSNSSLSWLTWQNQADVSLGRR